MWTGRTLAGSFRTKGATLPLAPPQLEFLRRAGASSRAGPRRPEYCGTLPRLCQFCCRVYRVKVCDFRFGAEVLGASCLGSPRMPSRCFSRVCACDSRFISFERGLREMRAALFCRGRGGGGGGGTVPAKRPLSFNLHGLSSGTPPELGKVSNRRLARSLRDVSGP